MIHIITVALVKSLIVIKYDKHIIYEKRDVSLIYIMF